ncbi:MAG TPA: helix-turn-helix domain-containing protein [Casimicrobiaceae bacterium]|nr:helix-turn-helix domain-containing protein [Casimicrobiaceae bacterium]
MGRALMRSDGFTESASGARRTVDAGRVLYHAGAACEAIYVVETGFFKTVVLSEDGAAQVTEFPMSGDVMGLDGFGPGIHRSDAVALSRATVCVVPRTRLVKACASDEGLARQLYAALSEAIVADHRAMLLLGSRTAEERVASFIIETAERLSARGYATTDIGLWMTREDIGSFLGLELETISRVLGRLQRRRLVDVHRRHLHVVDGEALRRLVAGELDESTAADAVGSRR